MWKNLKNKDRQPDRAIVSSTLTETAERNPLQGTANINNGSFSISSRPAFGRKQTQDVLKGLPALPFNELQVSGVINHRPTSQVPTVSSVYSQPSPKLNDQSIRRNSHEFRCSTLHPNDVSPPGSPCVSDGDNGRSRISSREVSPVSDSPNPLARPSPVFTSSKFNSNIPIAKKTRKFWNRPINDSPERDSNLTHWDVYSGEPTTREKGKPPQTTPSAVKLNAEPSPGRLSGKFESFGNVTYISGGSAIGRKRLASRDLSNALIVRPEWKGAGGRHKIVSPLLDKPLPPGKSPTFPAGSENNQQEPKRHGKMAETSTPSRSPCRSVFRSTQPSMTLNGKEPGQQVTPLDPPAEGSLSAKGSPAVQHDVRLQGPNMPTDDARSPLARNPSNEEITDQRVQILPYVPRSIAQEAHNPQQMQERQSQSASDAGLNSGNIEGNSSQIGSRPYPDQQLIHLQDQPRSLFNSINYATNSRNSPPTTPKVSSISPAMVTVSTTPDSILNRKRPVRPAGTSNSKVTARKPTPSELGKPHQTPEGKRKSLPRSPPEVEATSRISSLQAKLDDLRQRRRNLQTVIHELTNVVQPSSFAYDMASRQEIKKTVEGLARELAEVVKDEHDMGLKLHRALKRDDQLAAYEPTSIWVRRVTS